MSRTQGLFGLLLLHVFLVSLANALVVEKTIALRSLTDFEQFGFAANGEISLTASITPPQINVSIFICTDKEFDQLTSFADPNELGYCSNVCEYSADYRTNIHYRIPRKNRYHLVMMQCGVREPLKATVQYTLLNPGGEQLPLGEIPLPDIYIIVTCVWAILVGLSGYYWLRNKQHIVMLHALLSAVGVLKLAVVIVALCYWHTFKTTGKDIIQLKYLQSFIYALSETAFFCSLLLISKGWRITRSNLPPSEIRTISVALVLLLSTLLFFSFYNDGYYFLSLMIMYFFMLPKIFTSITRNTRALNTHLLLARYANVELNAEPVHAKIKMFKTLRTAVILYLGSILIISSMKIIMWWFLVWVTYFVSEIVTIVMIVAVCVLTRPRENGVFSPRSYFEGGPFPILNMQQFDHFDELFGDQIWDPDMVFRNNMAIAAASGHPHIDVTESIVIEYPVPSFSKDESNATYYFPRLAIATPDRGKDIKEKEKDKDNSSASEESEGSEKGLTRRRRGTAQSSSSLLSSTAALLSPESPSLVSSSSSSPLLIPSSSTNDVPYDHVELDVITVNSTATQTSPISTPTRSRSPSFASSSTTTTTTTTNTASVPSTETDEPVIYNNKNTRRRTRTISTTDKEKEKKNNNDEPSNTTTTTTTTSTPSSNTSRSNSPAPSLARLESLNSPAFTSSSSLITKRDGGWQQVEDDDEDLL